MRISDVLRSRGSFQVATLSSQDTIARLLEVLAERRIGAVVVSDDGQSIAGIVSERDVVRHLVGDAELLSKPVASIMTAQVHTCTGETTVEELAEEMTANRFRHVPVVEDGKLISIVSIGDVVKFRIDMLTQERDHLVGYINQ